jgi:LPXTG-motif cell wall-anchored protein
LENKVEDTTYTSAFESDGGEKILTRLPDGEYKLDEVYVPAGYINTLGSIYFTIEEGVISSRTADSSELVELSPSGTMKLLTVTNEPGAALPHTGGIGTTIFYIFGSILVLVGGIYFIARRRAAL